MAIYDPADDDLQEGINTALPVEVELNVDSTDYIDDELYDMLLDAFIAKAKDMGYDVVNTPQLVLGDWSIKAVLQEI